MSEECRTPPLLNPHETSTLDSGCKGHFLLVNEPCLNKIKSQNPLTVRLPNGATMESTHTASLDIPELKKAASMSHIFLGMENHSLLSVGQMCNEGYSVTFRIDAVTIYNSREVQNYERCSRLGHGTLVHQLAQGTSTTFT
jgi:deoxyxylulose-5-phosphate synthase